MRGKRERQAEPGRELGAEQARSQQPHRHLDTRTGHGTHRLAGLGRLEILQKLEHVLREGVGAVEIAAQRPRGGLVGARRTPQTQIDAARIETGQRAELLGDLQRRVVGQHDAAGTDPDARSVSGDVADQHRRRAAGDARHVVVFGQPITVIAELLAPLREIAHVAEGIGDLAALGDGRKIEHGKYGHDFLKPPLEALCVRWGRAEAAQGSNLQFGPSVADNPVATHARGCSWLWDGVSGSG
jgi:hypothetical protein